MRPCHYLVQHIREACCERSVVQRTDPREKWPYVYPWRFFPTHKSVPYEARRVDEDVRHANHRADGGDADTTPEIQRRFRHGWVALQHVTNAEEHHSSWSGCRRKSRPGFLCVDRHRLWRRFCRIVAPCGRAAPAAAGGGIDVMKLRIASDGLRFAYRVALSRRTREHCRQCRGCVAPCAQAENGRGSLLIGRRLN